MSSFALYGDDALQCIKFFQYAPENEHSLVLVHGGAWRCKENTYDDWLELAGLLLASAATSKVNLIGINYRLSPEIKHPAHLVDVVSALAKLRDSYGITKMSLVGHSVGATLLLQLLNCKELIAIGKRDSKQEEVKSLSGIEIKTMYFVDGIYDAVDLIAEYGAPYKLFVDDAFVDGEHYTNATQLTWSRQSPFIFKAKFVVVQSTEDELLTLRQTNNFLAFLKQRNIEYELLTGPWGLHENVYRRRELAAIVSKW